MGALPTAANAALYFLVGSRHVYRIGTSPYINVGPRQQIEQQYADAVNSAQASYDQRINAGEDPQAVSNDLNNELNYDADQRDAALAGLYQPDDAIRISHPELVIQGDGPYQVIGVETHGPIWGNFIVYKPWPTYVFVGPAPYGWVYGHPYNPYAFHHVYLGWHTSWIAGGGLYVGLFGSHGYYRPHFAPSFRRTWTSGVPRGYRPTFRPGGRPMPGRPGIGRPMPGRPPVGGSRPGFGGSRPGFGSRPAPTGGRPGFGSRPAPTGGRPGFGSRPAPAGGRPGFGGRTPSSGRPGFGSHSPSHSSPPSHSGGHSSFGGRRH